LDKPPEYFEKKHLVSFGGAQSNAMVALAQLAHQRSPFTYLTREIPQNVATEETGNFQAALSFGMRHLVVDQAQYQSLLSPDVSVYLKGLVSRDEEVVFIPQGVVMPQAEAGVKLLADEINCFHQSRSLPLQVWLPSGTGTTAFYLSQHVAGDVQVFTVPCVGDSSYLLRQFERLAEESAIPSPRLPIVLSSSLSPRFGRPTLEVWETYRLLLLSTGIEFDLLYASVAWRSLLFHLERSSETSTDIMYVHCGGVSGNASQLKRYEKLIKDQ
jgi:1-aminocyclopropane-1-carboxylate deaminase